MLPSEFKPKYMSVEEHGDAVVATLNISHITDEENIEQLGFELFALVDQFGSKKVVISMSVVEYLTSSVLGKLITLHRKLGRNDGKLILCNISDAIDEILTTSNLIDYFKVSETTDSSLAVLQGN